VVGDAMGASWVRATPSLCHPDEASNASGWKDLGQRGASAAGSGSELLHPIRIRPVRDGSNKGPLRDFKTGTGFACAKLSEILPSARVARFVRMTRALALSLRSDMADCARGARNLTPNPFPSGKGNRIV